MPGQACAVPGCKNSRLKTRISNPNIMYHKFPIRKNDKRTLHEWIRICRGNNRFNFNPSNKTVCSIHFHEDDYARDLQHELLNLPLRKMLKKTAVPSLHLNGHESPTPTEMEEVQNQSIEKEKDNESKPNISEEIIEVFDEPLCGETKDNCRNSPEIIILQPDEDFFMTEDIVPTDGSTNSVPTTQSINIISKMDSTNNAPTKILINIIPTKESTNNSTNTIPSTESVNITPKKVLINIVPTKDSSVPTNESRTSVPTNHESNTFDPTEEYSSRYWKIQYEALLKKHTNMKMRYQVEIRKLRAKANYYQTKCMKIKKPENKEIPVLSTIFTKNQIKLLTNKRKRLNWTSEEIGKAFTLRYYSKDAYNFVKNELRYPLPGLSTLRRWRGRIKIGSEIVEDE